MQCVRFTVHVRFVFHVSPSVPELVARGVIHQMFPLHEQRILNQLMTSWVQAVCERQPLGRRISSFYFEEHLTGE